MLSAILADSDVGLVSKETLAILYFLVPGFMAAWIFYGLTAHKKEDKFERVVQALIFTVVIKVLNIGTRQVWWFWLKHWWHPFVSREAYWTDETELGCALLYAAMIGIGFAFSANWDALHRLLRITKITKRTSFPSEWYSAFHRFRRDVVLHLRSDRRVMGWADEWSDYPDRGHFILQEPVWLDKKGNRYPQLQIERLMIPVCEVETVEFLFPEDVLIPQIAAIQAENEKLIHLHEEDDAEKAAETKDVRKSETTSNAASEPSSTTCSSSDGD